MALYTKLLKVENFQFSSDLVKRFWPKIFLNMVGEDGLRNAMDSQHF